MWVLTKDGFVSIVEDRNDRHRLLVRGRREQDVLEVVRYCLSQTMPGLTQDGLAEEPARAMIQTLAGSDYEFRAFLDRQLVASWVSKQAQEIDYHNFKHACVQKRRRDFAWHDALHQVWAVLSRLAPRRRGGPR